MTPLVFTITGAGPAAHTAAPAVVLRLHIANAGAPVHALALRCVVQIEPRGRRYDTGEQTRLYELFGEPQQWDRSLHAVVWTHTSVVVSAFERETELELPLLCTYDLDVAAAKYLHAVRDGDVPLRLFFTGSIFRGGDRAVQVEPVAWESEAAWRLPARVWRDTMDRFFPAGGWIRVSRDTLDALQAYKGRLALPTWDAAMERLLQESAAREPA